VPSKVLVAQTLTGPDLKAFNTFENPANVVTTKLDVTRAARKMTIKVPPRSYSVFHLAVE
jgi:alpha-L-arabinofuranosidase